MYERGGSLNVMRAPAAGASSRCGATRRGSANVLNAFRSGPVSVSQARTRVGVDVVPVEHQLALAVEIAVEHQHGGLARRVIERRDDVDERHLIVAREIGLQAGRCDRIGLRLDAQIEHAAARVPERPGCRDSRCSGGARRSRWSRAARSR